MLYLTADNWAEKKALLNVSAEVYSDIEGAIRSGKMVMVPADEVTILDWTGSGYVILSMEDYSGTYRITGGLNGGTSAVLVNFAFIANAIITAVDMYQLVMLVFALSDAIALTGPIGLAITLGACVLITALLTACIVYYIESVELLFAYHMGSDVAGEELVWQAGVNFVFTALAGMGSKAIGRKATSHAAEALFKALGAEACEKLIDALGVSGASGLVKMLRKAGLLDDAITSMVNGTSKNGLKRLYRCVAQNIPAEMLLYLCNHSNLLDDYTDDVLRMLGDSSYLPGVVYGMLEKYGDDFIHFYQRHGDDAIEVLSKHGDELYALPESYRMEAIDLVMSYGDEVLEGIRKHGDDFMARYVNEGETFVQEYLMKGDEVFENGAKPDGSGTEDGTKPEEGEIPEDSSGSKYTEIELKIKAEAAIQDLITSTSGGSTKSMAVGAYDLKTGKVIADFAGPIPDEISPILNERAKRIGGVGSLGVTNKNTVGVCAEFRTINQLLLNGSDISNVRLTDAIRPRTGEVRPYCDNCLEMFSDILDN